MKILRVACLLVPIVLLAAAHLEADSGVASRPAQVLVLVTPDGAAEDPLFADLLFDTIRLELERSSLRVLSNPRPGYRFGPGAPDERSRLELAQNVRADFLLSASITRSGSEVEVTLTWYDAQTGVGTSKTSRRGRMDLSLDRTIIEAVRELMHRESDSLARWSAEAPPASPSGAAAPVLSGPAERAEAGQGGAAGDDSLSLPPEPPGSPTVRGGPLPPEPPLEDRPFRRFELTAGSSAFLAVGRAADYFKLGIFPSLSATWYPRGAGGRFGLGLYAGADLFHAQGTEAAAQFAVVPAGLDLRYTSGGRLALFARLSGGPALLSWTPTGEASQYTLIGYGLAGIGLYLLFTDWIGLALDTSYTVFITGSELIMGYSPGMYLTLRL